MSSSVQYAANAWVIRIKAAGPDEQILRLDDMPVVITKLGSAESAAWGAFLDAGDVRRDVG